MASSPTMTTASPFPRLPVHLRPTNGKCKNIVTHRVSCDFSNSSASQITSREASPRSLNVDRRNLLVGLCAAASFCYDDPYAVAIVTRSPDPHSNDDQFPKILDKVVRVIVKRPRRSPSRKEREEEEEILVVDGIEFERDEYVKFDVLVNEEDEGATASGPDKTEFVGSFSNVPQSKSRKMKKTKTCLRLGIGELLEDLKAQDDESLVVTLVPRAGIGLVNIGGVKIELD